MKRTLGRRLISAGVAAALALVGLALPAPTYAEVVVNTRTPLLLAISPSFTPCVSETVLLTGDIHTLVTSETDENGGVHFQFHNQPIGLSGEGSVTGDQYLFAGLTQRHTSDHTDLPFETTFVNNFRIIRQGSGDNLMVHATLHVTMNANGDVTADVSNTSLECR